MNDRIIKPSQIHTGTLFNEPMQVKTVRQTGRKDVANAVAFLASDSSSYILGQAIIIDGGVIRF